MELTDKKIFITGVHGFLGPAVVRKLKERGVPEQNLFTPARDECDVRIYDQCKAAVEGKDIVIHLAAITGGIDFHAKHAGRIFYENTLMNINMVEASRLGGVKKFIGIGSAAVYPADARLPLKEDDLTAGGVKDPIHEAYNISKLHLYAQGIAYRAQYGLNAIHLVLTNMYGPGDSGETGYVIPTLIRRILDAQRTGAASLEVWGTGKPTRDFLFVDDAAEGVVRAVESYDEQAPLNLGSGNEVAIKELVELLARLMEFKGEIVWLSDKPNGTMRRIVDISRARQKIGFEPQVALEEGLKRTVEWMNVNVC